MASPIQRMGLVEIHRQECHEWLGTNGMRASKSSQKKPLPSELRRITSRNGLARDRMKGTAMRETHNALPDSHWTNLLNENLLI